MAAQRLVLDYLVVAEDLLAVVAMAMGTAVRMGTLLREMEAAMLVVVVGDEVFVMGVRAELMVVGVVVKHLVIRVGVVVINVISHMLIIMFRRLLLLLLVAQQFAACAAHAESAIDVSSNGSGHLVIEGMRVIMAALLEGCAGGGVLQTEDMHGGHGRNHDEQHRLEESREVKHGGLLRCPAPRNEHVSEIFVVWPWSAVVRLRLTMVDVWRLLNLLWSPSTTGAFFKV